MKNKIALATLALLPMTVSTAHASGESGTITATSLNIREGASTSNKVLFSVKKGENVSILDESNGWYKIKTSSGKEGWGSATYISKGETSKNEVSSGVEKIVTANRLNVRSGASTNYRVIVTLNKGDKVELISESNGWAKIKHEGRIGHVSNEYLQDLEVKSGSTKKVNATSLNIRSGPTTGHSVVGSLKSGNSVNVISENNGWAKINFNGKIAYVSGMYLISNNENNKPSIPSTNQQEESTIKIVNATSLNVRSGASVNHSVMGSLKRGTKIEVLSESNGWAKVKYNDKEAYVSIQYLDEEKTSIQNPDTPSDKDNVKETKVVNASSLNMRSGAGTNYSVMGSLKKGTKVGVISESNGWSKIKHNDKISYVSSQYLSSDEGINEKPNPPGNQETIKVVNADSLNVRSGASAKHTKVGSLKKGTKVGVILETNGWSKIKYNNNEAYVSSEYLSLDNNNNGNNEVPHSEVSGISAINGSTIHYKKLNYSFDSHVSVQLRAKNFVAKGSGFGNASKSDIEYYLNPTNYTKSAKGMMQFLRVDSFKGGVTASELNGYLNSLKPGSSGTNVFYNQGQAFINASKKYDIDLIYFVAHSMWETAYGRSTLAQGQYVKDSKGQNVKVYNFFGIGAIDGSANLSGAQAALKNGWTTVEATIDGSAKWIAQGYAKNTKYNQNTVYKMKWNYEISWHQYATDVNWGNGIAGIMLKLFPMYDTKSNLVFEVPQYK